jgi:hypothetical protein
LGYFNDHLGYFNDHLGYFNDHFGIIYGHLVQFMAFWYRVRSFVTFFTFWYFCNKINLATLPQTSHFFFTFKVKSSIKTEINWRHVKLSGSTFCDSQPG